MNLTFQPVRVATGFDEEGILVFDEDHRLRAVLTHLSERFADLDAAQDWISRRLARS